MKDSIILRPLNNSDVIEHANLLYSSFNTWYWNHGWGKDYFACRPDETAIFYQIYNDLTPGCSIAAFDRINEKMMGACFYHPREHHVSLGIMSVHPDYSGRGVGRQLVNYILDFTRQHNFKSCRLVSSAINMDSFSLYNRAGFIPRVMYHDMVIHVPADGLGDASVTGEDRVREAVASDIAQMGELEMEISGIRREIDYRYAIKNPRGVLHATVYENDQKAIDGFMISVRHPALNMLGPCVARAEDIAIALIRKEIERFKDTWVLFSIAMDKRKMVEQMYAWKAINVETHLKEVWGEFPGFNGISMPSFLPETG
jgi:GNAT superfamily N-acetyltransferase